MSWFFRSLVFFTFCNILASTCGLLAFAYPANARVYAEFGMLGGRTRGELEIEGYLGATGTAVQLPSKWFNLYYYGFYSARIEFGSGFGIQCRGSFGIFGFSGLSLTRHMNHNGWSFHLGLEPFHAICNANVNAEREDYFEYQPAGAAGLRFKSGKFLLMPLARGGASMGTLGGDGVRGSYGAGLYMLYSRLSLAAEIQRISDKLTPVDTWLLDLSFRINQSSAIGARGEALITRDAQAHRTMITGIGLADLSEYRFMVSYRYKPKSLRMQMMPIKPEIEEGEEAETI